METVMTEIMNPLINLINGQDDSRQLVLTSQTVLGVSPSKNFIN